MATQATRAAGLVRIELLGGFCVRCGRRTIRRFRTRKTGILLARLACEPRRSHSREVLTDLLWPDADPVAGRHSFSQALSSLRNQIEHPATRAGAVLIADRDTVRLDPTAAAIDVQEFRDLLRMARSAGDPAQHRRLLAKAVELYRGELLPGYYEDWILREREQLAEAYLRALGQLAKITEERGDVAGAVAVLRRALSAEPLAEALLRRLLRLYARTGQHAAALSAYRRWEQVLRTEYEQEPDRRTAELVRSIQAETGRSSGLGAMDAPARRRASAVARSIREVQSRRRVSPAAISVLYVDLPEATEALGLLAQQHGARAIAAPGGEGLAFRFLGAAEAVRCAVAIQRDLAPERGMATCPDLPRMAIHSGQMRSPRPGAVERIAERARHLARCGRPGQILCSEATSVLARYGLDRGVCLRDLGLQALGKDRLPEPVFQIDWPGSGTEAAPVPSEGGSPAHLLPFPVDAFFGRSAEILRLRSWLVAGEVRLVTITGTGGTGKTRLSLEAGRAIAAAFADGICFVPLAAVTNERGIGEGLCDTLGIKCARGRTPLDQALDHLTGKSVLLILDNLEQILPAAAQVVQALLSRIPSVRCLCTSRERLRLQGEHILELQPLETPAAFDPMERLENTDSVRLFVDRVQAIRPDFQLTARHAPPVARICSRLEGIPLALELAAARAQVLTPGQMVQRLANRMDFLISRRTEIEPRHQTVRAAMEWSYRLLPRQLKRFLAEVTVFRGSWSLEAAEAVTGEPTALDLVEQLRECSLIQAQPAGEEMRYRMLETVREFAAEKLPPSDARLVGQRHAEHFRQLLREIRPLMDGANQKEGMRRLILEQENLRAAMEWSRRAAATWPQRREGREAARLGLELAVELGLFWWMRGQDREGLDHLMALLRLPLAGIAPVTVANGFYHAGCNALNLGDQPLAAECFAKALDIYTALGDRDGRARTLNMIGNEAFNRGDLDAARDGFERSLALHREAGNERYVGQQLNNLGNIAHLRSDHEAARALFAESLEIKRRVGTPRDVATSLNGLGCTLETLGDLAAARACHEEVLAIAREIEDERMVAVAFTNLASVRRGQGEGRAAWQLLQEGLQIMWRSGDRRRAAHTLQMMAEDFGLPGGQPLAIELHAAAERELEALGIANAPSVQEKLDARLAELRAGVGDQTFQDHWERGKGMSLEGAVAAPLSLRLGVHRPNYFVL